MATHALDARKEKPPQHFPDPLARRHGQQQRHARRPPRENRPPPPTPTRPDRHAELERLRPRHRRRLRIRRPPPGDAAGGFAPPPPYTNKKSTIPRCSSVNCSRGVTIAVRKARRHARDSSSAYSATAPARSCCTFPRFLWNNAITCSADTCWLASSSQQS